LLWRRLRSAVGDCDCSHSGSVHLPGLCAVRRHSHGPPATVTCRMMGAVNVSLLYFDGCPNWDVADERLREALALVGHGGAAVEYRRVSTPEEAEEAQFRGSPTILINARDPFLDHESPVGLSCRVYRTPDGLAGSPTVEQLAEALR
jgi:hypothetical protein